MAYEISKTGFANLPRSVIQIDYTGYNLTNANIVSGNYEVKLGSEIGAPDDWRADCKFLVYKGTVTPGTTLTLDPLILLFSNKAKDSSGKKYDVRITCNATMVLPDDYAAPYTVFADCTPAGILQITSVRGTFPTNRYAIEGTYVYVNVDILDGDTPIHETTMFACADIDVGDMYNRYYGDGQLYGVDGQTVLNYQEQVRPIGSIRSPIYMEPDTLLITNAEKTRFGGSEGTTSPVAASLAYQVQTPIQVGFALSDGTMTLFTQASDFEKFTIVSSAGTGGGISPSGSNDYDYGTSATYKMKPEYGYEIEDVKVDGVSVGAVSTYTFSNIKADHTIVVTFVNVIPPCRREMGEMDVCGKSRMYIPDECEET